MNGGQWAWVETATGERHRCPKQHAAGRGATPKVPELVTGDAWQKLSERERARRVRGGLSNRDLRRGLKVIGENYRPFAHRDGCAALPWEECQCPG